MYRLQHKYVVLILIFILGIALSVLLFNTAMSWEDKQIKAEFARAAENRISALERIIENNMHQIEALGAFYNASYEVERSEFRKFVKPLLLHNPGIQALEWIPRVPDSQRSAYEESAREEGFPNFQITERKEQGVMVKAARRDEYFPVYYVEPYEGNEAALGFDLASDSTRLKALHRSIDTGQTVATSRIKLVQERGEQFGFLVFKPIYLKDKPLNSVKTRRENFTGFVLGVFRIGNLMENALTYLDPQGIDIHIYDDSASGSKRFLYLHSSRSRTAYVTRPPYEGKLRSGLHYADTLNIGGRKWLLLCTPIPDYISARKTIQPWGILLSGLLFTGLLAGYFLLIQKRIDKAHQYAVEIMKAKEGLEHEIIERKKAEEMLRESEARLKSLIRVAPIGIGVLVNRVLKQVNDRLCEMLGYTSEELLEQSARMLYPTEEEFERVGKEKYKKIREQGTGTVETRWQCKNGRAIDVMLSSTPLNPADLSTGVTFTALDITQRKQSELALRTSEEKFSKAFRSSPTFITISTIQEGRFIDVNDAFLNASGYQRTEVIGRSALELSTWPDHADRDEMISSLKKHGAVYNQEVKFRSKAGDIFILLWSAELIDIKEELCILAVAIDITERKKLESQLFHAQRMEAVGKLAGGIAHDFNNILTSIVGFGSILKMKLGKNNPLTSYVDNILDSTDKAANLTKSLLTFSRKQIIELRPVELNEIIRGLKKLLLSLISEEIELKTILFDKDLTILADSGHIEQVIMNLATNAQDAMPKGGRITIETELVEINDGFSKLHGFGKPGMYALLSITDTGIGMDEETKRKVFEPFFTTKEVGKGTGLGLSIIYGIVKEHKGYVNVYSEPGKGTTFRIYLPEVKASIEKEKKEKEKLYQTGESETILLAEDESAVRDSIRIVLEEFGYNVIEAVDGIDAVEKFIEYKDEIQLLIIDLIMPKMNGKEAFEEIKKLSPGIKAIFTSGYTAEIIDKKKIFNNDLLFVSKPFSPDKLLIKIRDVLENQNK